jgi:hypothetical protein
MTFLATPFAVAERTLLEDDMSSLDAKQSSESEWNTSPKNCNWYKCYQHGGGSREDKDEKMVRSSRHGTKN